MFATVILLLKYESIGAEEKLRNWHCGFKFMLYVTCSSVTRLLICHGSINS